VVPYWSSRKTRLIEGLQSIVLSRADGKLLGPDDDLADYLTWKVYWWGNHRDKNLVLDLQSRHAKLADLVSRQNCGQGYKKANQENDSKWLRRYKSFPVEHFRRYGKLDYRHLEDPPARVERQGVRAIYGGERLLIKRGITESGVVQGEIVARIEKRPFCFTNAINGIKLAEPESWEYQIILGIFWSSLARYFFFVTGGSWGVWHHELHLDDEILSLPVCLPEDGPLRRRLFRIVQELQHCDPDNAPEEHVRKLEDDLDDAVFEMYGLGEAEIDLVRDMCDVQMDFFYNGDESAAARPIDSRGAEDYCRVLSHIWSKYVDPGTELRWRCHASPHDHSMLAVVFSIHGKDDELDPSPPDEDAWTDLLRRLDSAQLYPVSSRIYLDGMVRAVTRDAVIVVKRNEKRFWTRSMAREDAEATLVQAMTRDEGGDN
jgi:hypothetical protein